MVQVKEVSQKDKIRDGFKEEERYYTGLVDDNIVIDKAQVKYNLRYK